MRKRDIVVRRTESIYNELDRLHTAISRRAYDLFRSNGTEWGGDLRDWLAAERELITKPAVELHQKDGHFEVLATLPGIEAKDLDVQVTPEDVLIKAESTHEHTADKETVHVCEFGCGKIFRSVHLPEQIDPASAKAEFKNGMLQVTAAIAKAATTEMVDVKAA
jgi:HSP20 family protein